MRTILLASACLLFLASGANGQSYEEKYKAKLQKPFFKKITWVENYGEALDRSKRTGKPIFAYFTRSYAP